MEQLAREVERLRDTASSLERDLARLSSDFHAQKATLEEREKREAERIGKAAEWRLVLEAEQGDHKKEHRRMWERHDSHGRTIGWLLGIIAIAGPIAAILGIAWVNQKTTPDPPPIEHSHSAEAD